MDTYEWADSSINATRACATGFTELLTTKPYPMSRNDRRLYDARLPLIRSFQQTVLNLFKAALRGSAHPTILHWLLNETPESLGIRHHLRLEDRHFTLPVFFRTDEVKPGRINEIQCPGSLWGELQLAFEYTARLGYDIGDASPADQFAAQLTAFLQDSPLVHHCTDRASAPPGVHYFIQKTRPRLRYWGIDRGVTASQCNFVRHHAFIGVWSDDYLGMRLDKVGDGFAFDLPPHMVFDQKASLVLPFWSLTRQAFPDEIRGLFPFTAPLMPAGIELPDGACVTIEDFSRWPRSQRSYYAKYAGSDWRRNWGSKEVYRLSNMSGEACLAFLRQCLSRYERGEIWLLQKEERQDDEITYQTRDGAVHTQSLRAKFSGFYGPGGCLGVIAQHRRHNKVHGQEDTTLGYVLTHNEEPVAA